MKEILGHGGALHRTSPKPPVRRGSFSLASVKILVMAGLLAASLYGFLQLKDLPITGVSIEGGTRASQAMRVEDAIYPEISQGFFTINITALQQRIQSLPWVAHATVRRIWPSQLVIQITEYVPLAEWESGGVVTEEGQWIDVTALPGDNLIRFAGPAEQAHRVWEQYQFFQTHLLPLSLRIVRLELAERGAWSMTLDNGFSIALGRQDIEKRFERFIEAYPCKLNSLSSNIRSVDLRYTQGMAVGWRK